MALSEVKRLALQDAGLLDCYLRHQAVWRGMALVADQNARGYLGDPLPDDVVELLLPALRVHDDFRTCIGNTSVRADKWYRYFAEYVLHLEWGHVVSMRPATTP